MVLPIHPNNMYKQLINEKYTERLKKIKNGAKKQQLEYNIFWKIIRKK